MKTNAKGKLDLPDFLPLPRIFLIVTGIMIIIIMLYLLMTYDKISSSVQEAAMAMIFFVALPTIYIAVIYRSLKKQLSFVRDVTPKLEMLGFHFSTARSSLALVLDGQLGDLKIQFSPFSPGKDRFDFYMITLFHQNPQNMGLLCTNSGYLIGKNALSITFRKHFGLKRTVFPGMYDNEIKCWIRDGAQSEACFHDDKLKYTILKLNELLKFQNACFVLDDQCLRIAFPINTLAESTSLEAASELCHAFGDLEITALSQSNINRRQNAIENRSILVHKHN
jgi:hypothetical protein